MTTRILPFLVGNPYKPSFVTVTGWGVDLTYTYNPLQLVLSKVLLELYRMKKTSGTLTVSAGTSKQTNLRTSFHSCHEHLRKVLFATSWGKHRNPQNPENTKLRPTATFQYHPVRENAEHARCLE